MGIPQRMAVVVSGLVFAGAAVLTTGAATPASAASVPGTTAPVNAAIVNPAHPALAGSWCTRHPWKCRGFRHHHKFRHNKFRHHRFGQHGRGGWNRGGWGGRSISIRNENINISRSSSSQFHGW